MARIKMLSEIIKYLMDPFLVARIQNFFGVGVYDKNKLLKNKRKVLICEDSINQRIVKKNGHSVCESETNGCTSILHSKETEISKTPDIPLVTNYFWYYLFLFGSELGDEIFYTAFITIWFWNIDGEIGRKVILVWATVMTTGQILKEIIRWPRPACPPVIRLQNKWAQEYGMPSTHATVSVAIPFSLVLFAMNKYNYPITLGLVIATIWSILVCISRLYLGMHTVLDVIAGSLLAIILMIPLVPLVNYTDHYFVFNYWPVLILVAINIAVIVYFPTSEVWTPTRSDTTMVISVATGIYVGAWLNYQTGIISPNTQSPPYDIVWPTYIEFGHIILRTILGFCLAIPFKIIWKTFTYKIMCAAMKINSTELMESENFSENKSKILVDLIYRYLYCFTFGILTVHILPKIFTFIKLGRLEFYSTV